MFEVNEEIYRKAKVKDQKKRRLKMYIQACVENDICPECGKEYRLRFYYDLNGSAYYSCEYCKENFTIDT